LLDGTQLSTEVGDGLGVGQMAKKGGNPDALGRVALRWGEVVGLGDGPEATIGGVVETFE
jgi:hypothetical protein